MRGETKERMFGQSAYFNLENGEVMLCFPRDLSSWAGWFGSVCLSFLAYKREHVCTTGQNNLLVRMLQIKKAAGKLVSKSIIGK